MRKVINGVAYDTETARQLARSDHDHESSQASWALYKKPNGAYFEVTADHDGVVDGFRPLTRRQARAFLETTANHLVEQHFGPASETDPLRFSRPTRNAAIEVLEDATRGHSDMTRLFLKLGAEVAARCADGNMADRFSALITYLDQDETRRTDTDELLQDVLVEMAVSCLPKQAWGEPPAYNAPQAALVRGLDRDGFTVADGGLRRTLPSELGLTEAEDEVGRLLVKHGFTTARGHLDQALDNHGRGHWAAANGQIRAFIEGLLDEIAVRLDAEAATLKPGETRRVRLGQLDFLSAALGEWSADGKNFANGLMKRLHPAGAHPGLSDQDDSTFRRHIVLIAAKLWLTRFDAGRG